MAPKIWHHHFGHCWRERFTVQPYRIFPALIPLFDKEPQMKIRHLIAVSIGCLGIAGCATSPAGWSKGGVPSTALEHDKAECAYQAKAATASYHSSSSSAESESSRLGAAVGDGIVIAEKQIALTNECMKARGYAPQ